LKHYATSEYWEAFENLPKSVQRLAEKNYALLLDNPSHPSLSFKKVKEYRSVRVGLHYRALGIKSGSDIIWFWIGTHAAYDKLVS